MRKTIVVAAFTMIAMPSLADSEILKAKDISTIAEIYDQNEVRFARDFKGREFADNLPFSGASKSIVGDNYIIHFGSGHVFAPLSCTTSDAKVLSKIANWNKGDIVNVSGLVDDVTFGTVELAKCSMNGHHD